MEVIETIRVYMLMFFIYSFLGWVMESVRVSIAQKKWIDRGFLIGPWIPIYGFGSLLVTILLNKYIEDYVLTFVMSMLICGTLEFVTSYVMEKLFKARWWDYSDRYFNLNGRICLENLILFGIGCCLILYVGNPLVLRFIDWVPNIIENICLAVFLVSYIVDTIVSFKIILNIRTVSSEVKDNTREISAKVKKIIHSKSRLYRRLVKAFPNIKEFVEYTNWTIKSKLEEVGNRINEKVEDMNNKITDKIEEIKKENDEKEKKRNSKKKDIKVEE